MSINHPNKSVTYKIDRSTSVIPYSIKRRRNPEIVFDAIEAELERRGAELEGYCPKPFTARAVRNDTTIRTKSWRTLLVREHDSLEQEMTERVAQLPDPDGSLLLRELDHRIKNELTSAICAVSAKAVQSDSVAVKAALLDVVDFLHQWADVHRALYMPDQKRLTDAASYLQQLCFAMTKYRLDCLAIRVLYSADDLRLEGERCWKLGLIVSELLTNVARHVEFGAKHPELRVKLMLEGNVVRCGVSDNGSAPEPVRCGRGLTIVGELASSLGGRVHTSCAAEGSSFLLTFPLTEAEQRAVGATHNVLKQRKMGRPRRLEASR